MIKLVITKSTDRFVEIVPKFRISGYHYLKEVPEIIIIEDTYESYNKLSLEQQVDFINDLKEFYDRQNVVMYTLDGLNDTSDNEEVEGTSPQNNDQNDTKDEDEGKDDKGEDTKDSSSTESTKEEKEEEKEESSSKPKVSKRSKSSK